MSDELYEQVEKRAKELLPSGEEEREPLDFEFIRQCLEANERGDGVLFATINRGKFLYNTTPKDGEWFRWAGHVWEKDDFRASIDAVEICAIEYMRYAEELNRQIQAEGIEDKKEEGGWKISLKEQCEKRASRLRSENGAKKALVWAPVVDLAMACRENEFDRDPWLLPVRNGVINLRTGVLIDGHPDDMLTRCLDIDYDPHADYGPFLDFLNDIAIDESVPGSEEIPAFLKRVFGYTATGHSHEQYIFVFIGPGRNGKGVLFNLITSILGPYYHEINRAMLLEQRNEPSPNAASEHKYSLLGKRMVIGAETNKGQKIDASAVKALTGKNNIQARPNFGKEIIFPPTHTVFLQTNNMPHGLTREFSLVERLVIIEFLHRYVDDVEAKKKEFPGQAGKFRKKDPDLEEKLMQYRQGILRWIVEGCREWQEIGLAPPNCILRAVSELAREEDYMGRFISDCLVHFEDKKDLKLACTAMYDAFEWWWSVNNDPAEKRAPAMKTVNKNFRERGFAVQQVGGRTWIYGIAINFEVATEIDEFVRTRKAKS